MLKNQWLYILYYTLRYEVGVARLFAVVRNRRTNSQIRNVLNTYSQEQFPTGSFAPCTVICYSATKATKRLEAKLSSSFSSYDFDESGTISAAELKSLVYSMGYFMTDVEAKVVLSKIDVDK
jgi:Ca2+-binding EF-hand superfamily protein